MKRLKINSVITVFHVQDIDKSLQWYKKWLGEPNVVPDEGIVEYRLCENSWLQLSADGENRNKSAMILGVDDIHESKNSLEECGIITGDIMDYEVVLVFDVEDIDGNTISFVQEVR